MTMPGPFSMQQDLPPGQALGRATLSGLLCSRPEDSREKPARSWGRSGRPQGEGVPVACLSPGGALLSRRGHVWVPGPGDGVCGAGSRRRLRQREERERGLQGAVVGGRGGGGPGPEWGLARAGEGRGRSWPRRAHCHPGPLAVCCARGSRGSPAQGAGGPSGAGRGEPARGSVPRRDLLVRQKHTFPGRTVCTVTS